MERVPFRKSQINNFSLELFFYENPYT